MTEVRPTLRVLGSGSSGNLSVIEIPDRAGRDRRILVDLGLGPRTTRRRLEELQLPFEPAEIDAVLITHADQDHLRPSWSHTLRCHRWKVHAAPSHHPGLARLGVPPARLHPVPDGGREAELFPGVRVTTALAPHDDHGTAAFRLTLERDEGDPTVVGWATDLGRVTPAVETLLEGCDVIAIESNYDPDLQAASPRPPFLKRRITGGHGHLSNEEALQAVRRSSRPHPPSGIVLLHLSEDCNHPDLVMDLWRSRCPELAGRVHIAHATSPLGPIALGPRTTAREAPAAATLWG